MRTLLKQADFDDEFRRVMGIVDFVNALYTTPYTDEEIEQVWLQAVYVYHVDLYLAQVSNGGHLQFFLNLQFNPRVNQYILRGLNAMGAKDSADNFQKAMETFTKLEPAILSFEETPTRNIFEEFAPLFALYDNAFQYEYLCDLEHNYVAKIENLALLSDEQYDQELKDILDSKPR